MKARFKFANDEHHFAKVYPEVNKIRDWYERNFSDVEVFFGGADNHSMHLNYATDRTDSDKTLMVTPGTYKLEIYLEAKLVGKRRIDKFHKVSKMLIDELEFFDRLGYKLHSYYANEVGQEIEDWF